MRPITALQERTNANARLVHRGRFLNTVFLLEIGETAHLVHIHAGRVERIETGPFVMPRWSFALRASRETWEAFCHPLPAPGFHDLMALVKSRRLRVEGDQHPFMANLLYFKAVIETLRLPETV